MKRCFIMIEEFLVVMRCSENGLGVVEVNMCVENEVEKEVDDTMQ